MKLNNLYALSFVLAGLFSTANAARPDTPVTKAAAPRPKKPAAAAAPPAASSAPAISAPAPTSAPAPAPPPSPKAPAPTGNLNGEGLPNGSPTDTGCVDGCGIYPPPAPDGNTANSLEIYYLSWFPSYKATDTMNMSFWTAYNPAASGTPPATLNIDLYDQFGKVLLGGIAQNVAVKASATPAVIQAWKIPTTVNANFNVSNQFMIVFTGANNWRRDRLIQIDGIKATPGGGPNPAYGGAVSGQTPVSAGGPGSPNPTNPASPGNSANTAASVRSDLWVVVCVWTFLIAQVVGFVLV